MKTSAYFLINIFVVPLILLLGDMTPISIAVFWIVSFLISLYYLKNTLKNCGMLYLLSPCILTYLYSSINYITGSLYYVTGLLSATRLYRVFFSINQSNLFIALLFLNSCNIIVVYVGTKYTIKYREPESFTNKRNANIISLITLFLLFVFLHVFIFDFSSLGGKSSTVENGMTPTETGLNFPLILGVIAYIVHMITNYRISGKIRVLLYVIIILTLAVDSVGSKRELFFALIAVCIVECVHYDKKIKLTLKNAMLSFVLFSMATLYILSASIVRGYGGFGAESLSEAIEYVPEYAQSDIFNEVVGNNFETPYHYATAVIMCDYVISGKTPLLYGETFLKVLFIPIPRSLFNYKPRKMIDVFTETYDSNFREEGGSFPVSVYTELLANFSFLSIFLLYYLFLFFQKQYVKFLGNSKEGVDSYVYVVPFFSLFLQFVRGSGLESLILYAIMGAFSAFFASRFMVALNLNERH